MASPIHPYISGQPFRIKYLEAVYDHMAKCKGVLHWKREEILDWYLKASLNKSHTAVRENEGATRCPGPDLSVLSVLSVRSVVKALRSSH